MAYLCKFYEMLSGLGNTFLTRVWTANRKLKVFLGIFFMKLALSGGASTTFSPSVIQLIFNN